MMLCLMQSANENEGHETPCGQGKNDDDVGDVGARLRALHAKAQSGPAAGSRRVELAADDIDVLFSNRGADAVSAVVTALTAVSAHPIDADDAAVAASFIARAALWLAALRARSALPTLCRLLGQDRFDVETTAAVARAVGELVCFSDRANDEVLTVLDRLSLAPASLLRVLSVRGLEKVPSHWSRARLRALAHDDDESVRVQAAAALAHLMDVGPVEVETAEAVDVVAVRWAQNDLGDTRAEVRDAAVELWSHRGDGAVGFLASVVAGGSMLARASAAQALGRIQSPEAIVPLLVGATASATTRPEVQFQLSALRALKGCLADHGREQQLSSLLSPLARNPDRFVRAAALGCLGRIRERPSLSLLLGAMNDDDPLIVESASLALLDFVRPSDDDELAQPLWEALRSCPADAPMASVVREALFLALSCLPLAEPGLRVRIRHAARVAVEHADRGMRKAALVLLRQCFDDEDPPPLPLLDAALRRLADPHPQVRIAAGVFVAAHLPPGMSGAVGPLAKALLSEDGHLARAALQALRRHDTHEAKTALAQLSGSIVDEPIAAMAKQALRDFAPTSSTWSWSAPSAKPQAESARGTARRRRQEASDNPAVVVDAFFDDDALREKRGA
jgi:HEAT repeat protein